jgi:hypothetical protein
MLMWTCRHSHFYCCVRSYHTIHPTRTGHSDLIWADEATLATPEFSQSLVECLYNATYEMLQDDNINNVIIGQLSPLHLAPAIKGTPKAQAISNALSSINGAIPGVRIGGRQMWKYTMYRSILAGWQVGDLAVPCCCFATQIQGALQGQIPDTKVIIWNAESVIVSADIAANARGHCS